MSALCGAGVDWRQKMENQRGAVLATELKNNANKLAKWTAAALVSGADMIKLGYVSRVHMRDNFHHAVLGTQVGCCRPYFCAAVARRLLTRSSVLCTCSLYATEPDEVSSIMCSRLSEVTSLEGCVQCMSQKACPLISPLKHVRWCR